MNFFEKLDFLMKRDNIKNLHVLSQRAGVPYTTVKSFYMNGMDNVKFSTIDKLCKFFGVTIDYLLHDDVIDVNYGTSNVFQINQYETEHIAKYRFLDEHGRMAVDFIINHEYGRCKKTNVPTDFLKNNNPLPKSADENRELVEVFSKNFFDDCEVIKKEI